MTKPTKCTGRYDRAPMGFGSTLHQDCFGCAMRAVRTYSSDAGFVTSPVALFRGNKCLERKEK